MVASSLLVGWREWASLPDLNIPFIKIKIDTGAFTSALHAYDIDIIEENGQKFAEFFIHPLQKDNIVAVKAKALVVDLRNVKSSNGQKQLRVVIRSKIKIGNYESEIDITLTNRDIMKYRMLFGRKAMKNIIVSPGQSYCCGKISHSRLMDAYDVY
jgi:hypothetical protein